MNLKYLTDKTLLQDTKLLAQQYRTITASFLLHIKEIEQRKLYTELGYTSLFTYIVQELGFSESSASRRITAMKMVKEIPELEKKIETGELTLSNLGKAANVFKQENITDVKFKKEVLATIENTSTRTCEKTLNEIIGPSSLLISAPPKTYPLHLSLSEENFNKYEQIRELLAHKKRNKEEIFSIIFDSTIEKLTSKKFKTHSKKITSSSNSRYITASIKKAVYLRDKVCQKCGSKNALEFDHIKPFALGGKSTEENLRILCRNCNQRQRITSKLHFP